MLRRLLRVLEVRLWRLPLESWAGLIFDAVEGTSEGTLKDTAHTETTEARTKIAKFAAGMFELDSKTLLQS